MPARTRILVILRDPDVRRKLVTLLGKAGYDVFQAEDRADGLPLLYEVQPSLIFLEVVAQQDENWETFSRIRLLTNTPIILLADQPLRTNEQSLEKENAFVLVQPLSSKAVLAQAKAVLKPSDGNVPRSTSIVASAARAPHMESQAPSEQLSWLIALLSKIKTAWEADAVVDAVLLDHLRAISKAGWIALYLLRPEDTTRLAPATFQLLPEEPPWSEKQIQFLQARIAQAVESRQTCISAQAATGEIAPSVWSAQEAGLGPFVIVPLIGRERIHGALAAINPVEPSSGLMPEQIQLVHTVAQALALAMDSAVLVQRRGAAAILDETTGIYSDAYLSHLLALESERRNRYGRPFALVRIDWLNAPEFDKACGYPAFIETLGKMANLLRKQLRAVDIVARCGDRGIALALPETDSAGGQRVAERVAQVIEANISNNTGAVHPIIITRVDTEWDQSRETSQAAA